MEERKGELPYLVALAIIKMRIIASHDAILPELDFVFQQTEYKQIQEVKLTVQQILVGSDIAGQREQLTRI